MLSRFSLRFTLARWAKVQKRLLARRGRGAVAGVMLVAYLLILVGLPMPEPLATTSPSAQPYPCQDGACGCSSAEKCWRSCCCYTDSQKLAWAKQNGVTPPAEFLERFSPRELAETVPPPGNCCVSEREDRRSQASIAATTACGSPHGMGKTTSCCKVDSGDPPSADPSRVVMTIEALKCRGVGTDWMGLYDVIPAVPFQIGERTPLVVDAALPAWNGLPEISFPPPSPPPRSSFFSI